MGHTICGIALRRTKGRHYCLYCLTVLSVTHQWITEGSLLLYAQVRRNFIVHIGQGLLNLFSITKKDVGYCFLLAIFKKKLDYTPYSVLGSHPESAANTSILCFRAKKNRSQG